MNRGLTRKAIREVWVITLLCGAAVMAFEGFLAYLFWTYQEEFSEQIMQMEFVQKFVRSILGAEVGGDIGAGTLLALAWVHPTLLALIWAHAITICTRVPAGEIDRGTIDVLFSLPVTRWGIYRTESIVCACAGAVVLGLALAGSLIGYQTVPPEARPSVWRLGLIVLNLFWLYAASGAIAWFVSSLSDRRGKAVGTAFTIVLTLVLHNFLTEYWQLADRVSFLNLLSYYRPMLILEDGSFPVRDLGVLIACTAAFWCAAGAIFSRRDIATV